MSLRSWGSPQCPSDGLGPTTGHIDTQTQVFLCRSRIRRERRSKEINTACGVVPGTGGPESISAECCVSLRRPRSKAAIVTGCEHRLCPGEAPAQAGGPDRCVHWEPAHTGWLRRARGTREGRPLSQAPKSVEDPCGGSCPSQCSGAPDGPAGFSPGCGAASAPWPQPENHRQGQARTGSRDTGHRVRCALRA